MLMIAMVGVFVTGGGDYADDHSMMRGLLALKDDEGNDDRHDS